MTVPVVVSGLGLHLREWADDDLPVLVELFDDPDVSRWTPLPSPFDLPAARTYLDQARTRRPEGRGIQLAITTDGRAALGEILLVPAGRTAELAYAVGRAHRGQGLTTRAVRLMTGYAYRELAMDQVVLRIDPANMPSVAVARATGFELTDEEPITRRGSRPLDTWRHLPSLG
jgi:RimJ/RimL family protein N-acetyltransferase